MGASVLLRYGFFHLYNVRRCCRLVGTGLFLNRPHRIRAESVRSLTMGAFEVEENLPECTRRVERGDLKWGEE
ncbi:ferredoxin-NADP oxidoreductase [Anopheles sinensis]|uniref:Ferredoxin-NADP oxidoreductase n=1 Tax=Anopheles sinensis TaxID=74873 RepID=A0A084VR53_ANOSI|nr:ferredoxin-NADP oxidoreductase [Anopheles sinensis]